MNISGMNKLTLLDYPGHVACIIFTQGCNLNCSFCHNSELITVAKSGCQIKESEVMKYLEKRKNILDGIVISGGEPLMQPRIKALIKKIKAKGFKVKLDTNGTHYALLKELIEEKLIDYVAMDIKSDFDTYARITGRENYDFRCIENTIALLAASGIDYEFRTTIVKEFHNQNKIENICALIGQNSKYYLQNYVESDQVLEKGLHGFTEVELKELENNINLKFPNVKVRGL